jgi:hypothetical protein
MTTRVLWFWTGIISVAILGSACGGEPGLPVVVSVDSTTQHLQWSDAGGLLEGEVPWVLRRDVLGPDTYLVATTFDSRRECVEEVSFRVTPIEGIEYTITLVSDLQGSVFWDIRYGDGKEVKTFRCTPRPTDGQEECQRGGIPKPLFGTLTGTVTGTPAGSDSIKSLQSFRLEHTPLECQEP